MEEVKIRHSFTQQGSGTRGPTLRCERVRFPSGSLNAWVVGLRTLLTRLFKLVMARDFWRQGFDSQMVSRSRSFTGIRSNPLDSTRVVETFWTRPLNRLGDRLHSLFEEPLRVARTMKHPQHVDAIGWRDVTDPELLKAGNRPQPQACERRIEGCLRGCRSRGTRPAVRIPFRLHPENVAPQPDSPQR